MIKLVTVAEMRAIEQEANINGLTFADMMQNAGQGLGQWVYEKFRTGKSVIGLVGSGNNGGDTLVALDFLSRKGWNTCAYLVRPRPADDPLMVWGKETSTAIIEPGEDGDLALLEHKLGEADIILDGVIGTSFQLPLKAELALSLSQIKALIAKQTHGIHILAVDCPSGVDCETGEAAPECIPAETTICMAAAKMGLLEPGFSVRGKN